MCAYMLYLAIFSPHLLEKLVFKTSGATGEKAWMKVNRELKRSCK